jgi:TPR repeat protein
MTKVRSAAVAVVLATALVAATKRVDAFRDRPYLYTNLYLPSGKFVEQTSLGYREIAADWIWFQAVQYYGGYALQQHDLAYFNGLIDIVTDLDPHFEFPYIFGSVVMSQDMGDLERGVEVLKKGMRANPTDWHYPFEIGFLYYVVAQDANRAARYFELASRLPDSGAVPARFAAFVHSKAGHEETSIRMWEEIARESDQPYMRDMAKRYIEKLRAGDDASGSTQQPAQELKRAGDDT